MRNTDVMEKSSKHKKKKKCRSPPSESSEDVSSESDEKTSKSVDPKRRHSPSSSDSSPEREKVKKHKKRKKKHKRKHKQSESEAEVEEVHLEKSSSPELVVLDQGRAHKTYSEEREASIEVERRRREDGGQRHERRHEQRDVEASVENERRDHGRREEERRRPERRREEESYGAVRIKREPNDEDDARMRHAQSSLRHRHTEGRRERTDAADYQSSRHQHRREGERPRDGNRSRQPDRRGDYSASRRDSTDRAEQVSRRDDSRHNEERSRYAAGDDDRSSKNRQPQRDRRQSEERPQRERRQSEERPQRERRQSEERSQRERRQSEERPSESNRGGSNGRGGRGRGRGGRGGRSRFDAGQTRDGDEGTFEWGKTSDNVKQEPVPAGEKEKPNFATSGKLTEEVNTFKGVVIKYSEPPEARKPRRRWRFYPFKGEKGLQTLYIHRQSSYLIGRDRKIADIPVDHPSCSKQHAALQYRLVPFERENGTTGKRVRPYIIDLESANGTFVNNVKVDAKKYVELMERDVVKFGFSSREYVLLHEQSKDDDYDDIGDYEEGAGEAAAAMVNVVDDTQRKEPVRLQPLAPLKPLLE